MSLDRPSGGPSSAAEPEEAVSELSLVSLLRIRGAPLLGALEAHYPGSREVADAASAYAFAAAAELGLSRQSAELAREAAKLHDVGRLYVPVEVLSKPAWTRTTEEGALVDAHHEWGAQLARGAGIPDRVCEWIRLGAERYDGGGPNRLAGKAIPLQSRISRAAYACHAALVEASRESATAHARRSAFDALSGSAGRELDPKVVDALESVLMRARTR